MQCALLLLSELWSCISSEDLAYSNVLEAVWKSYWLKVYYVVAATGTVQSIGMDTFIACHGSCGLGPKRVSTYVTESNRPLVDGNHDLLCTAQVSTMFSGGSDLYPLNTGEGMMSVCNQAPQGQDS
eukprot:2107575-Amphidinium_carterae.2